MQHTTQPIGVEHTLVLSDSEFRLLAKIVSEGVPSGAYLETDPSVKLTDLGASFSHLYPEVGHQDLCLFTGDKKIVVERDWEERV